MDAHRPAASTPAARRWDVLAIGDPCADVVVRTETLPPRGGKVLGRAAGIFPGGTEANVACAVARLGGTACAFGRVGSDAHGALLRTSFEEEGVATKYLASEPGLASASATVLVDAAGEKTIVYAPMPPAPLDLARLDEALRASRIAYLMPYSLDELHAVHRAAREHGTRVAIDLEAALVPDRDAMNSRVALADVVFFNEAGFRSGTGQAPTAASLAEVLSAGPQAVVVTLGAGGAMALDANGFVHQEAFAADAVDTTGAGDTFNAAFLVAWLDGQRLAHALRHACAAASCAVAAVGARAGMPRRHQVAALLSEPGNAAPSGQRLMVFGSINADLIVQAQRLPQAGETLLGTQAHVSPGGKGANQAHAAALYGAPTALYGMVGRDAQAAPALALLEAGGVDLSGVGVATGQPTGLAFVTVGPAGENTIVVVPGANRELLAEQVPEAALQAGGMLLLQLETDVNETIALARRARQAGCRVLLNVSPVPERFELPPGIADILVMNRLEVLQLCRGMPSLAREWLDTARDAAHRWQAELLVTLGKDGAVFIGRDGSLHRAAAHDIEAVDTTGAGDTYVGVFAAALLEGQPVPQAMEAAASAAALACLRPGVQVAQPSRTEIEDELHRHRNLGRLP
jgi:ribokinase